LADELEKYFLNSQKPLFICQNLQPTTYRFRVVQTDLVDMRGVERQHFENDEAKGEDVRLCRHLPFQNNLRSQQKAHYFVPSPV
jgi:hypothetical protein